MDTTLAPMVAQLDALLTTLDRVLRDDFKRGRGCDVPANITLAQYQVLSLAAAGEASAQAQIARALGVTGPTVVRIVDALEAKGLVQRTRDHADRRIVRITLTERGRHVHDVCAHLRARHLASLLGRLPRDAAPALLRNLALLLGEPDRA